MCWRSRLSCSPRSSTASTAAWRDSSKARRASAPSSTASSDFVNFGVAPALVLYFWGLHDLKSAGWIAAMTFAICAALRLARFNVMIDDPDRPAWTGNFFVGMPAPAGAITVLLPIYAAFLGLPRSGFLTWLTLFYTLGVALLMVSRLPVFSGKRVGTRVPPEMVGPLIVLVVLGDRASDRLSVDLADGGHARLSRQPAVRLAVLSRLRAAIARGQGGSRARAVAVVADDSSRSGAVARRRRASIALELRRCAGGRRARDFVDACCPAQLSWPPRWRRWRLRP